MGQLFRRKLNTFAQISLIGIVLIFSSIGIFLVSFKWSTWESEVNIPIDQPVPFSHQHHVSELGIDCRYCHTSVTKSAFAGLPPTHTCMTCHSQIWHEAPMLKPVRDSYEQNRPLQWNRVHRLPKYVYFDHSVHVNKGIGCTSCHGQIKDMPLTWKTRTFYMRDCLTCHREPERYIRPKNRVFDSPWMEKWRPPQNQLELGTQLVRDHNIPKHRLTDCYTCHR
jgi:hypothetical protein